MSDEGEVEALRGEVDRLEDRVESLETVAKELEAAGQDRHGFGAGIEQSGGVTGVKRIIEIAEVHGEEGASIQDVHSVAAILDLDLAAVREETERLHRQGEIYYWTSEVVRTT